MAVVAGGTAGVGRAIVDALLADGYRVGILARGQTRLDALRDTFADAVFTLPCDVGDATAVQRTGAAIEEALGPISVWVNAAMLTSFSPFALAGPDEFDRIVRATFLGQVNGTRTALSLMEGRNSGRIVNVGSGLSYRAVPYQAAYCASKHAINGFTDALRCELIRSGSDITLSVVQLPAINTPQFDWARNRLSKQPRPAAPVFTPELAARAVMRAIRDGTREIFVGRSVLKMAFGHFVAPGWLDRKLADAGAEMQKSWQDEPGGRPDNLDAPDPRRGPDAHGSYDDEAQERGLTVDAAHARLAVFGGVPVITFLLGLAIG
ncbi:SDR family oxidoreductase [Citreimonas salinaria]|uniref:SDR family oxidoreductase n=1 Tax=Citreimonas salinaria TaxID=321339 RepID=UPI001FDFACC9|nr:SDR family oxidoreductase [Citreimonas salinaria]